MVSPSTKLRAVKAVVETGVGTAAEACRALGLARSSYYRNSAVSMESRQRQRQIVQLSQAYGVPEHLRSDNGPEFIAYAIQDWLREKAVKTIYITPGAPWENAYIESFHDKLRDECLNREIFGSLWEARVVIEQWRLYYNAERPHSSLGYQTPMEFAGRAIGCSGLRSGYALPPSRTAEQNIKPMAELYL
jgi:transposase InsO family protein